MKPNDWREQMASVERLTTAWPRVRPLLKRATGTAFILALELWSVADFGVGRRTVAWAAPRTAYFMVRILKVSRLMASDGPLAEPSTMNPNVRDASASGAGGLRPTPATEASRPSGTAAPSNEAPPLPDYGGSTEARIGWLASVQKAYARLGQETKKPATAAALAGATIMGVATVVGVTETALGVAASYSVFRALAKRRRASREGG